MILENKKYTGIVILLDSATQEYRYQMKECLPPIITENEFRAVQEKKKKRSNLVTEDDSTHRSRKNYSSRKKEQILGCRGINNAGIQRFIG